MRLSTLRKIPISIACTIVLSLLISFTVIISIPAPVLAGTCAIGGCDCGDCDDCTTKSARFDLFGVSVVAYGCACGTDGPVCQGSAI